LIDGFRPLPPFSMEQHQAWFDITVGEEGRPGYQKGRVVIQLF